MSGPIPDASQGEAQNNGVEKEAVVFSRSDEDVAAQTTVGLQRQLKARHLSMIALGGALGTGLVIGTGAGLARAGPAPILITYSLVGFVVYLVLGALGEMATWIPLESGFSGYTSRYVDPAMGFAVGYCYWFKYLFLPPAQLTAAALVLEYWVPRERVNPGVWIAIFLVVIVFINLFGVAVFGEMEFYLSAIKILVVLGILILSLILVCGGGPNHHTYGFHYWSKPGAFNPYIGSGNSGRFLAILSVLVTATYAFLGTELICITFGEAANPRRNIPRAIRLTFYRILVFYILSILFLGMLVPYSSDKLKTAISKSTSADASPFVVAFRIAGVKVIPGFLNACFLIFVFSAANSDLYIASRTIYGLAAEGLAPRFLAHTTRNGVPIYSLLLSSVFACIGFLNVHTSSATIFNYFTNLVTVFGILTWISVLVTHIFFVRARRAQGIPDSSLNYVAPFGLWGTYGGLAVCIFIALCKNYSVFVHSSKTSGHYGNFDYKNFITGYLGIPIYLVMLFAFKFIKKSRGVGPREADLFSGKKEVDDEEIEYLELEKQAARARGTNVSRMYRFVSWLF
ncbi:amino acid permease [Grosmannia clavigera kw1407]|uniref:Amino acid permease n=1 Tax=Grosmannia clavigera (strain kw1407 / UAMH 11150) TaxID=655863 RepID=F0XB77_GROCL|nr:amino acid permease [Grosmannia clavigera kw1407]EFX04948.1 amino acid permease [Grosmannia clavigera kw1407]